jgi:hypothetical protein
MKKNETFSDLSIRIKKMRHVLTILISMVVLSLILSSLIPINGQPEYSGVDAQKLNWSSFSYKFR